MVGVLYEYIAERLVIRMMTKTRSDDIFSSRFTMVHMAHVYICMRHFWLASASCCSGGCFGFFISDGSGKLSN